MNNYDEKDKKNFLSGLLEDCHVIILVSLVLYEPNVLFNIK